jgi:hypothetical protein
MMMKRLIFERLFHFLTGLFFFMSIMTAHAGIIDFETTANGGTPVDNDIININDQFMAGGVSVSFGFDTNGDGVLDSEGVFEQVGESANPADDSGFLANYGEDTANPDFQRMLGNFFLRQKMAYQPFGIFHIIYNADNPVTSASGEIWDIDGGRNTEQFVIKAFNGEDLLESQESPLGIANSEISYDGRPWAFGFTNLSDITRIEISFTGSKTRGIGLAFNNFSPVEDISNVTNNVPEPTSLVFIALSVFAVGFYKQRNEVKRPANKK